MNIKGENYQITYENNVIRLSGKLSLMLEDYGTIEEFFHEVIETQPKELTLDIRELEYLNSSGIKTICVSLILEADDVDGLSLKIVCSKKYTWQQETIPTFKDLMDEIEILFE